MLCTFSGVAQSFFAPSFEDVVELTRAISTGRRSTVASSEVRVMIVIVETNADLSRGI